MATYNVTYETVNNDGEKAHHVETYYNGVKAEQSYKNLTAVLRNLVYDGMYSYVHVSLTGNGQVYGDYVIDAEVF